MVAKHLPGMYKAQVVHPQHCKKAKIALTFTYSFNDFTTHTLEVVV